MSKAKQDWKNRIVGHGEQPANQFLAHELNARRHPGKQRDALRGSLNELGWIAPVIVSKRSGKILDGHARIEEALSKDENAPVPFVELDVSESEEKLILASYDPITLLAEYDKEALDALLKDVQTGEAGLQAMLAELAQSEGLYFGEPPAQENEGDVAAIIDQAAELQKKWQVKRGQVWSIGNHRLMCGDSTKADDVARLLGDQIPNLMVTDPPYGVEYDANWRNEADRANGKPYGASAIGKVTNDDEADWTKAWELFKGNVVYVWHAGRRASVVQASLESVGFEMRSQIIWAKSNFAISRGHYHWKHEPCWYAVRKGENASWIGDHSQTSLWEIDKPMKSETGHSTQKPIECMARPIRNHEGEVYDPFVGSGTTLVACENLSRKCYAMEISENYCAVILERMTLAFPQLRIALLGEVSQQVYA